VLRQLQLQQARLDNFRSVNTIQLTEFLEFLELRQYSITSENPAAEGNYSNFRIPGIQIIKILLPGILK